MGSFIIIKYLIPLPSCYFHNWLLLENGQVVYINEQFVVGCWLMPFCKLLMDKFLLLWV